MGSKRNNERKGKGGPKTPEGKAIALANLIPAKPGEIRNPGGRRTAGATVREWINSLAEHELNEAEIRKIARDAKEPWTKRAAANRILRTVEAGDLSDFAGLLRGENGLEDLRAMGINTEVIKRLKQKTRKVPAGNNSVEEIIEREIELYDRAGDDFDRVCDRTEGKPRQGVEVTGADGGPLKSEHEVVITTDLERCAKEFEEFARRQVGDRVLLPNNN